MRKPLFVVALSAVMLLMAASLAVAAPVPIAPGGAQPSQFQPAQNCGCHSSFVDEWELSMHSKALRDPIYLTKLEEANKATDGALGPFCNTCHGPIAAVTGELGKDSLSPAAGQGITCDFCHQVTGLKAGVIANTSHLIEPNGVKRAQLKDPKAPHPAQYSEFHTKAEICGGCHNVDHPINGMHLEATYSEWLKSPYAKKGVVCQDCHMTPNAGTVGPVTGVACAGGPERQNIYHMTFAGAQVALGNPALATEMLKSAASIEMSVPAILAGGTGSKVAVRITNEGAGHYLPTGLTEMREMWLEVNAVDSSGKKTLLGERKFGTILQDDKGNAPVELWEATKIKSDDRIPPMESVENEYEFTMPEGSDFATVTAQLLYKSTSDEFAAKAKVDNPTTVMAETEQVVWSSAEARDAAAQEVVSESGGSTLWVAALIIAGLGVIAGLVIFFLMRARKIDA